MITRIELHNFMSHARTVIEPAAGLTVLVGPNNVGKSAIVAALKILCRNENSTYVLRHGQKECAILIDTSDGHHIEWRRKTSPSYLIDGQKFDRLRQGGLPEELHKALRLPAVDSGEEDDFDVHFGTQKTPIFLLNSSPAVAARFFASSSDAIRLVEIQRRHKEKLADRQKEKSRLEADSARLQGELTALEPIVELDARLRAAEHDYEQLSQQAAALQEANRTAAEWAEQAALKTRYQTLARALTPLPAPPTLPSSEPLARLIDGIAAAVRDAASARRQIAVLGNLPAPPKLDDPAPLDRLQQRIARGTTIVAHGRDVVRRLAPLAAPPPLADAVALKKHLDRQLAAERDLQRVVRRQTALLALASPPPATVDTHGLEPLIQRVDAAARKVDTEQRTVLRLAEELTALEQELRAAASHSRCRLCGSPLDPDRVLARAAGGLSGNDRAGGHDHA